MLSKRFLSTLNPTTASVKGKLVYKIKMLSHDTMIERRRNNNGILHKLLDTEEIASPLLGTLQWAIDKSYIQQFGHHPVSHSLRLGKKSIYISKELENLQKYIILGTIICPLPFFMYKSSKLMLAKRCGLSDLLRLSGVTPTTVRISHIIDSAMLSPFYAVIITIALKAAADPVLPYSNGLIIAITIILYFSTITALAFVTSTLSKDFNHANSLAMLVYLCTVILDFTWHTSKITTTHVVRNAILSCLLPHTSMYLFWDEVIKMEALGRGVTLSNILKTNDWFAMSPLTIWFLMCVHVVFLMALDWYLDLVKPGRNGIPKKWNFIFERTYWFPKKRRKVHFHVTSEQTTKLLRDSRYFETSPQDAEVAIKLINVTMAFKDNKTSVVALQKVCLDLYEGEVSVILGKNGAGKTTLMSIITGMFAATKGSVYINGQDIGHRVLHTQEDVALCPQRNITYFNLTVKENIQFFERLKVTHHVKHMTADQLITHLHMDKFTDVFSKQLPKGLQRCLQVACTLVGGAQILVLDEPTSGMDIEARHRLWNLIMELRGAKTIVMSTSYLEEADALGDRIAILDKGHLRCHGSPTFLKETLDTGFNLIITLKTDTRMKELQSLVEDTIPNARYKMQDTTRVIFVLPHKEAALFPLLFDKIEAKRKEFKISMIDVGMFMEQIFSEFIEKDNEEDVYRKLSYRENQTSRAKGWKLHVIQLKALLWRVYSYLWMKKYQFLILQVILPVLGLIMISLTTNIRFGYDTSHTPERASRMLYDSGPFEHDALSDTAKMYGVHAVYFENVEKAFADPFNNLIDEETIGLTMTANSSKLIVPLEPSIVTMSVNLFSNIYMNLHMPHHDVNIITSYETARTPHQLVKPKSLYLCLKWCVWVVFLSIVPLAPFVTLSITERLFGSRDNHTMAGCCPIVHYGSKLIAHMSIYIFIVPPSVITAAACFDYDQTFNGVEFFGAVFLLLIAFGPAFLVFLYVLSFIIDENFAISRIYIMAVGFGILIPILLEIMERLWIAFDWFIVLTYKILLVIAYFCPLYPFSVGLIRLTLRARLNAYCNLNKHLCPDLDINVEYWSSQVCCESKKIAPFGYLNWYLIQIDITVLILQFFVYSVLVILLEKRIIHSYIEKILNCGYTEPLQRNFNLGVQFEKYEIENKLHLNKFDDAVLIAHNIHKKFFRCIKKKTHDSNVKGISIMARKGECTGILGPPFSGKSTLLRILAGCTVLTKGEIWVDGYSIKKHRSQYIHKVALAMKIGGVDMFLTGRENLRLIHELQGYSRAISETLTTRSLNILGLNAYGNIQVKNYSYGCLRRLSLCVVTAICPEVAFIDEPMLDVDQLARPLVLRCLERLLAEPSAVLVSDASLDFREMESLFDRIAIVFDGQLVALGPATEVLQTILSGYMARIKLKVVSAYGFLELEDSRSIKEAVATRSQLSVEYASEIDTLKNDFAEVFPTSMLTEEHLCVLYFYIKDEDNTMLYSDMFKKLQFLSEKHSHVIEDYTLSVSNIEDLFWRIQHVIDHL
ncbi:phospholipid-transporting ATPase ABCA3-like [Anticarsia gemmatalis]|uniref:phospholipid-transporting ATPase ABCA3-like n=1 Tax=Anticarsia gemmatalis TaxID=129554 RepID=UPI003F75C72F